MLLWPQIFLDIVGEGTSLSLPLRPICCRIYTTRFQPIDSKASTWVLHEPDPTHLSVFEQDYVYQTMLKVWLIRG